MSWLLRRREQGRRERGRGDRGRPAHPDVLTPAEWRVLECVRGGLPNAEIAVRLGVSVNTVRYHVSNMLAKLELDNRHDLAAWDGTPAVAVEEPAGRRFRLGFPLLGWVTGHAGGAVAASVAVVAVAVAAVVVVPLVAGNDGAAPGPVAAPADEPEPGVFEEMLQLVPDRPEHRRATLMGDLARYRELSGAEPWDPDAESEGQYLQRLAGLGDHPPSEVPFPGIYFLGAAADAAEQLAQNTRVSLGFGLAEVDQWLLPGFAPPHELGAMRGDFERERVAAQLEQCVGCDGAEEVPHAGEVYWRWGEDLEQNVPLRFALPAYDHLGRGGRLAIVDDYVLRAVWNEGIEAMLDARGGVDSLADVEDFLLAARGMDRLGALGALISERTQGPDAAGELPPALADAWALDEDDPLLVPYAVFAIGPGWDGDPYTAVVLVHASTEAAEENARRLPGRVAATRFAGGEPDGAEAWGEVIEEIAIEVEGRVVLARLHGHAAAAPGPAFGFMLVDPLLRHE